MKIDFIIFVETTAIRIKDSKSCLQPHAATILVITENHLNRK